MNNLVSNKENKVDQKQNKQFTKNEKEKLPKKIHKAIKKPAKAAIVSCESKAKVTTASSKAYMHFDFYFKRTLFRTMTLFYKQSFKSHFDTFRAQKDTNFPIEKYLAEWVQ